MPAQKECSTDNVRPFFFNGWGVFLWAGIKPALAMSFPFGLRTGMVGVPFGLLTGTGPAPALCQAEAFMPILASTTLTT